LCWLGSYLVRGHHRGCAWRRGIRPGSGCSTRDAKSATQPVDADPAVPRSW